jgi:hypothetical protein
MAKEKGEKKPLGKMSNEQIAELIFTTNLPSRHFLRKEIEENKISFKDIQSIITAASAASGVLRKQLSNAYMVSAAFTQSERELNKIISELEIRTKMYKNLNNTQKRYFKDCLINGWGVEKEFIYIGRSIGNKFSIMAKNGSRFRK